MDKYTSLMTTSKIVSCNLQAVMSIEIKKVAQFTGHSSAIYALENSPEGNKNFSGGGDKIIAEWDLAKPDEGNLLANIPHIIYSLKLISQNKMLLAGQSAGGIHVIDLVTRKEIRLLQYHTSGVFDLALSEKHDLLFSVSGEGNFCISKLSDFLLIKTIKLADEKLRSISVHPSQNEIAVGCGDGSICVYELPLLEIKKRWMAHQEKFSVNTVCYSPDGNLLFSGSRDAHLNVFDLKNNYALIKSIPAHNYAIYSIVFNDDGNFFATASRDKTIKIWNAATLEVLARLDKEKSDGHANSVNKLLRKNNFLISCSDDRSIIVWEVKSFL